MLERHRELGLDLEWDREAGPTGVAEQVATGGSLRSPHSVNAKAAEQLLKASRLLQKAATRSGETPDASRRDLGEPDEGGGSKVIIRVD